MIKHSNPSPMFLILSLIISNYCLITTQADGSSSACPYPCYPPPIPGTTTPATGLTTYPPPAYYSPPGGGDGGGYGGGVVAPPPPDPIMPYFPYYYRNGVHRPTGADLSATSAATAWTVRIVPCLAAVFGSCAVLVLSYV